MWLRVASVRALAMVSRFRSRRVLAAAAIACAVAAFGAAVGPRRSADRTPIVVFRYDDFGNDSPRHVENALLAAFRAVQAPITFAVIPFGGSGVGAAPDDDAWTPLDACALGWLRAAQADGTVEVAQHGFAHVDHEPASERESEFRGVEPALQRQRLQRGRDVLTQGLGAAPTAFVPPFNTFDAHTAQALVELGFTILSGDKSGVVGGGHSPLRELPSTCTLGKARAAIAAARSSWHAQPVVTVLLHPMEFVGERGALALPALQSLLADCRREGLPLRSVAGACRDGDVTDGRRLANDQAAAAFARWLPRPFVRASSWYLDGDAAGARVMLARGVVFWSGLAGAFGLLVAAWRRRPASAVHHGREAPAVPSPERAVHSAAG